MNGRCATVLGSVLGCRWPEERARLDEEVLLCRRHLVESTSDRQCSEVPHVMEETGTRPDTGTSQGRYEATVGQGRWGDWLLQQVLRAAEKDDTVHEPSSVHQREVVSPSHYSISCGDQGA